MHSRSENPFFFLVCVIFLNLDMKQRRIMKCISQRPLEMGNLQGRPFREAVGLQWLVWYYNFCQVKSCSKSTVHSYH